MSRHLYDLETRQKAIAIAKATSQANAAEELGIPKRTISTWCNEKIEEEITYPQFPEDDLPVEELIEIARKRNRKHIEHAKSKKWFPIKVNIDGPIGVAFMGDPHVDDNGCNWDLLYRDCHLLKETEGAFGINVGDTTNNWVGRLARLFANQDTSQSTARKFAQWLLSGSGVTWLTWVMGNHDMWNEGEEILRRMNTSSVPMEDHQARMEVVFPNKRTCKIWTSHQFPGHSMWNTLHGPQRAAHTKEEADIYACGHTHNWAMHQEESASREFTYWLIRARGYKFVDDHAARLGHDSQQEGATIFAVINPEAKTMSSFVQCFADIEPGVEYLKWMRR